MAKIARIVAYVYDPNNDYYHLGNELERVCEKTDMYLILTEYMEKLFEWNDNLRINYLDCTEEEVSKFFRELPDKKVVEDEDV